MAPPPSRPSSSPSSSSSPSAPNATAPTSASASAQLLPRELVLEAERVAALLDSRDATVCVAESSSGGLVSAALLGVAGAGKWYRGGTVLYTLESRVEFAGWTDVDVQTYRGPSPEVVSGLATNVCRRLKADLCIGETGLAQPSPRTRRFPTGLTCLAVSTPSGPVATRTLVTEVADRHYNMVRFATESLRLLADVLEALDAEALRAAIGGGGGASQAGSRSSSADKPNNGRGNGKL